MDWWIYAMLKQEEYEAEAIRRRLLAAAERAGQPGPSRIDRALAGLGRRLTRWGELLEARAPRQVSRREAPA